MSTQEETVKVDQPVEKTKKPRTPAQIEATRKMVEANKLRREEKAKAEKPQPDPEPVVVEVKKSKPKAPRKSKAKVVKAPEGAVVSELVEDPEPLEPEPAKPKPKRIIKKPKKKPSPPPSPSSESSYSLDDESSGSEYNPSSHDGPHSPSPPPQATGPIRLGYRMRSPL